MCKNAFKKSMNEKFILKQVKHVLNLDKTKRVE